MNKFLHLQILIVASFIGAIMCQHYNNQQNQHQGYGAQSHFYLHQNHPTPTTIATSSHITPQPSYHHQQHPQQHGSNANVNQHFQQHQFGFQSPTPTPTPSFMDLDRFNQQAKAFKDQINYFNHQQSKNLRNQINSVHQDGSDPHFDFIVNQNYSDLEKASEQFVSIGNMAAKQNMPKVIKITKTVAVKQPVPVPYPVPVVKVVKEQVPVEQSHVAHHHHYQHSTPATMTVTTEKTFDFKPSPYYSNYTSYIGKYSPQPHPHTHHEQYNNNNAVSHTSPSPTPAAMATAHKIAESYIKQEFFSTPASLASIGEYDTRPFYVKTSEKEMIKYIPVPYYVDEHGNRHEVPGTQGSSSSSSSSEELSSDNYEPYYKQPSSDNHPGKFQTFTFSYHPQHTTQPTPSYHEHSYSTVQPDTKYYYSQGDVASVPISSAASDNSVSPSHHYAVSEVEAEDDGSNEHEHTYQYKYVYER